jgi:hypothetical protein
VSDLVSSGIEVEGDSQTASLPVEKCRVLPERGAVPRHELAQRGVVQRLWRRVKDVGWRSVGQGIDFSCRVDKATAGSLAGRVIGRSKCLIELSGIAKRNQYALTGRLRE